MAAALNNPIFSTAKREIRNPVKIQTLSDMSYLTYRPAQLKNVKGVLHIEFYFKNPITGKWKRYRKYGLDDGGGLNRIKDEKVRLEKGEEWAAAWTEALKSGYVPDEFQQVELEAVKRWNMFQALNLWKINTEQKTDRPKTVSSYGIIVNHFLKKFKGVRKDLTEITGSEIEQFLLQLKKSENWSNTTYNNYLRFTKTFFNFCVDQGYIEKSPSAKIKKLRAVVSKHKAFNDKEFEKIKKHASPKLLAFIEFLYETALRPKEARLIKFKDVQEDRLFVSGKISKNKRDEYVPLSKGYAEKLKGENDEYIFGGKHPVGVNHFGNAFAELKKLLELDNDHTLYSVKHTRAIHLTRDKVDPYAIMKLFRHSSLEITMRYLRELGQEINREAVDHGRPF